jgi:hypothetical protein
LKGVFASHRLREEIGCEVKESSLHGIEPIRTRIPV